RHALRRLRDVVERLVLVAGGVLDGPAHQPHPGGEAYRLRGRRGRVTEALLEVGGDGQIGRLHDGAGVGERLVAQHLAVTSPEDARGRSAGRREGRKTETGENARGARIPGVGNHEGRSLVQGAEAGGLVALTGCHEGSFAEGRLVSTRRARRSDGADQLPRRARRSSDRDGS